MKTILVLVLVGGCGAATTVNEKPGPRGLRADQHMAAASREDQRAYELQHWPIVRPEAGDPYAVGPRIEAGQWYGSWDTTAEHQRLAQVHRSEAGAQQGEYEEACGNTPFSIVSVSPLQRYGIGGSPIDGGSVVYLTAEAGPPDRLLQAMRCHRAWMMMGRTQNMDDCPLDLPGLQVEAHGDANGIELTLKVENPALVPELRRRTAHDLEAARGRHETR